MKQNLYTLYEEDVHPELLPADQYEAIKQKYSDLHRRYWETVTQPQVSEAAERIDAYLDAHAKKFGFENYEAVVELRLKTHQTPEEIVALREFNKVYHDPLYAKLHDDKHKVMDKEDEYYSASVQDKLYEILQMTCKMGNQKDAKGNPLPGNDEWLHQYQAEADKLKNTSIGRNYSEEMVRYHIGMDHCHFGQDDCNQGVMFLVEPLRKAGYEVVQFRSGMVQDWPYSRYTQDDPAGRYKAGDHMFWGSQEPMARLVLLDRDYNISVLAKIAADSGMLVEKTDDCIEFRFPAARDGSSIKELVEHFAMKEGISFYAAEELRQADPQKFASIVKEHGGYAIYTDEMLHWRLNNLTAQLVNQIAQVNRPVKSMDTDALLKDVNLNWMFKEFMSLATLQMGPEKTMQLLNEAKEKAVKQGMHVYLDTKDNTVMVVSENDARELGMLGDGKYIDLGGRIDNVNIYQAPDGGYMMRCKIDGEQQCARPLDDKQVETWNQYKDKNVERPSQAGHRRSDTRGDLPIDDTAAVTGTVMVGFLFCLPTCFVVYSIGYLYICRKSNGPD